MPVPIINVHNMIMLNSCSSLRVWNCGMYEGEGAYVTSMHKVSKASQMAFHM